MKKHVKAVFVLCLFVLGGCQSRVMHDPAMLATLPQVNMFAGDTGEPRSWEQVFAAMDEADVIIIGESHTDANGHALQTAMLRVAVQRWPGMLLSVEEFDRSQQAELDAFGTGELSAVELKQIRAFVNPRVRKNWEQWFLPKLEVARESDTPILASNAPLKYSRIVRNAGCDNLPELGEEELALFECPSIPVDPEYRERFAKSFRRAAGGRNSGSNLKQLDDEQIDILFRAHRVWDATMADSIAAARADGAGKVVHLVGGFHSSFNGGLIQELQARDPEASVLVVSLQGRRNSQLSAADRGRGDVVVYTRSLSGG